MATIEAVRERPILFSGEMVRAILDGRKTQTRRVVKPQPPDAAVRAVVVPPWVHFEDEAGPANERGVRIGRMWTVRNPYGAPGDRLVVKEAAWMWCERQPNGTTPTGRPKWRYVPMRGAPVHYVADPGWNGGKPGLVVPSPDTGNEWGWRFKVARFLPRWACRITLEIMDEGAERLQEISEADALAEGIERSSWEFSCEPYRDYRQPKRAPGLNCASAVRSFNTLWDSINAARGYGWETNPYVWTITFRVLES